MNGIAAIITGVKVSDKKIIDGYSTERKVALEWFRRSGKTQAELSKFCGLGQGTISGIKDGKKGSRSTFAKIAKAFNKEYADYFKDDHAPIALPDMGSESIWRHIASLEKEIRGLKSQIQQIRAATDRRQLSGVSPDGIERRSGEDRRGKTGKDNGGRV